MDIKEYLINDKTLNRSELARRMWPGNKKPESYLSQKLAGEYRQFTRKDAQLALEIIQQMAQELNAVTIEQGHPTPTPGPKPKPAPQEGLTEGEEVP